MKLNSATNSFTSNYKFPLTQKVWQIEPRLQSMGKNGIIYMSKEEWNLEQNKQGIFGIATIHCEDSKDKEIESYLASKGIDFKKTSLIDITSENSATSRIYQDEWQAQKGHVLASVNVEKFDELFKKDDCYMGKNGENGIGDRYKNFISYLKSGLPIEATNANIYFLNGELIASINDGRHRYSVMRDLGYKHIPISLDKESYNLAKKIGLLK